MTVIAYDGRTVAADKMSCLGSAKSTVTKIFTLKQGVFQNHIVGFSGNLARGLAMISWLEKHDGAPELMPRFQEGDDYVQTIRITPTGEIWEYGCSAFPAMIEDSFYAIGSGMDFARAAMYCGKTAVEAVAIACMYSAHCGNGIDVLLPFNRRPAMANKLAKTKAKL